MEFRKVKLGQVIEFKNGKKRPNEEGIIPIYGGNGILGYTNVYNANRNNIIIGRVGAYCGCVYKNDGECWISDNAILGTTKDGNNYMFLYYVLKLLNLNNLHIGSSHPLMTQDILNNIEIMIPHIDIQNKIAKILYDIDKKIELNSKINKELEKISQLLFDNFIKESENIDYCKIKNFTPRLEIGNRPKGGVNNITTGIPSIGAESIKGLGYFDYTKTKYVTEEYFDNMKKGIIQGYELLIYKDGGKPGYFIPNFSMFGDGFPYEKCAINEHVFLLDFKDTRFNIFSYYYFNSEYIRHKLHVLGSKSAAIPGINQQDILNLEIPHIKGIDEEVLDILEANTRTIIKNSKQNVILTNMRDVLLPKLMNGEINLDKIQI